VGDKDTGFRYLRVRGKELEWEAALDRIERLAIPPGWTDVHRSLAYLVNAARRHDGGARLVAPRG